MVTHNFTMRARVTRWLLHTEAMMESRRPKTATWTGPMPGEYAKRRNSSGSRGVRTERNDGTRDPLDDS